MVAREDGRFGVVVEVAPPFIGSVVLLLTLIWRGGQREREERVVKREKGQKRCFVVRPRAITA